jgi:leader peptidase (prepilin peptidase)/N-methyltransferase
MEDAISFLYLVTFGILAFGLIVGSFANVVIHRVPREESIVSPPSRCPQCGASIRPWQNVPVLSWIFLLGRCAHCRAPISARYPAVEALHGVGFVLLLLKFGPTPFLPALLFFYSAMIILAFIDWDVQMLPNVLTLPGVLIGLGGSLLPGALIGWRESAIAAAAGYLAFAAIARGYLALRGIEGLGEGDWKLAAFMGAFLGVPGLLLAVFLACVSGLAYGLVQALKLRAASSVENGSAPTQEEASGAFGPPPPELTATEAAPAGESESVALPERSLEPPSIGLFRLPFGTFLAGAAIVVLFFGESILSWYRAQMHG